MSVYGHAEDLETFVNVYTKRITSKGFIRRKRDEANALVDSITSKVSAQTSSDLFDSYVKQSFLDNILRGGLPILLGHGANKKIYHTYSRIHGDIERDYNFFQIDTTYFSQGPGNFRDVNQNRRLDVFHTPEIGDFNIRMFLSFIQADGYNPLTVATTNLKVPADRISPLVSLLGVTDAQQVEKLTQLLQKPFRIGSFFKDLKTNGIVIRLEKDDIVAYLADNTEQHFAGMYHAFLPSTL